MKNLESVVSDLQKIINSNISRYPMPSRKNNTIRIKNVIIRESTKHGYIVINLETNRPITNMFSKTGAVAVAKAVIQNQSFTQIKNYDSILEKNSNDVQFYTHILSGNSAEDRKSCARIRLAISREKISHARSILDDYVLKDI
jgi:uncharacterized protein (DUF342 family)